MLLGAVLETLAHSLQALCCLGLLVLGHLASSIRLHRPRARPEPPHAGPSIALGGCGFWWPYMAGVVQYVCEEFETDKCKVYCTSGAAFPVVAMLTGTDPLDWCRADYPRCLAHWRSRRLGFLLDSPRFISKLWLNFLPPDAHRLVSDRLAISVTAMDLSGWLPRLANQHVSAFGSNEHLVSTLLATMNVPAVFFRRLLWSDSLGIFSDQQPQVMADGMFSEQQSRGSADTVRVDVFPFLRAGSDVRPAPGSRLRYLELVWPSGMERTLEMIQQGRTDAHRQRELFIQRGWVPKQSGGTEPSTDADLSSAAGPT